MNMMMPMMSIWICFTMPAVMGLYWVEQSVLDKLGYIAEYEGRTKNKQLEWLLRRFIQEFEAEHGPIEL